MDPLARMQLHSDSFRAMTGLVQQAADRLCGGKLVMVHEGGYAESYVPFCGTAVMEALSGIRTAVGIRCWNLFSSSSRGRSLRSSRGRPSIGWRNGLACSKPAQLPRCDGGEENAFSSTISPRIH